MANEKINSKTILLSGIPYLPRISWIVTVLSFFELTIITNEKYSRKLKLNRTNLVGVDGEFLLSVPVHVGGVIGETPNTSGSVVMTADEENWRRKHWHAIKAAYGQSTYFIFYEENFRKIILSEEKNLDALNENLLREVFSILQFPFPKLNYATVSGEQIFLAKEQLKKMEQSVSPMEYRQVFAGFSPNLSVLDLIFNEGPEARNVLMGMKNSKTIME